MRNFDEWLAAFRPSIADYKYYVDFNKVVANVEAIKIPLNILNSLVGSKNIEAEFESILEKYPETLACIPILLAKRELDIMAMDEEGQMDFHFNEFNCSIPEYTKFMRKTGLFDLMQNHIVNNLVDYVTGVETGLDSNGRKNRGGHLMEDLVESYLKKAGLVKGVTYFKEMYIHEIEQKWGIDLSSISNQGSAEKRFDKDLDYFKFVWFTDGWGWGSARNNLKETFDVLEHLYSISDLEDGIVTKALV